MENYPIFSIIITTYNRANLVHRAILSVLEQSYGNFELIIINGGSTDSTDQVVRSIYDKRIRYIIQNENKGLHSSRNLGSEIAIGKYLYFLDDDDELIPGALEQIIQSIDNLSSNDVKWFWFNAVYAETNSFSGTGFHNEEKKVLFRDLLCQKIRGDYALVLNREAFGTNGSDERLWGYEGLLLLKIHKEYDGYYFPKVILRKYRQHGARISNISILPHLSQLILGESLYLEDFGDEMKTICPHTYARHLFNLGYFQMLDGKKEEAKKNILLSLKSRFSLKVFIFYILSIFLPHQQLIFLCKILKKV